MEERGLAELHLLIFCDVNLGNGFRPIFVSVLVHWGAAYVCVDLDSHHELFGIDNPHELLSLPS